MAKLNTTDFLDDGLALDDAVAAARRPRGRRARRHRSERRHGRIREKARSGPGLRTEADEGYFVENAAAVKRAVHIPGLGTRRDPDPGRRRKVRGRGAGGSHLDVPALHPRSVSSSEDSGKARSTGPTASPATSASTRAASAAPKNERPALRPGHAFRPGLRPGRSPVQALFKGHPSDLDGGAPLRRGLCRAGPVFLRPMDLPRGAAARTPDAGSIPFAPGTSPGWPGRSRPEGSSGPSA